jgi:hypothetical protein
MAANKLRAFSKYLIESLPNAPYLPSLFSRRGLRGGFKCMDEIPDLFEYQLSPYSLEPI